MSDMGSVPELVAAGKYNDQNNNTIVTACLRNLSYLLTPKNLGVVCQTKDAAGNVLDVKGSCLDVPSQRSSNFQFTLTNSVNAASIDYIITGNNNGSVIERHGFIKTDKGYTIDGNLENGLPNQCFQVFAYSKNKVFDVANLNIKNGQNANYTLNINDTIISSPSDITITLRRYDLNPLTADELINNTTKASNGYKIDSILSSGLATDKTLGIMSVGIKDNKEVECTANSAGFQGGQFQAKGITNYLQSSDLDKVNDYVIGTKPAGLWLDKITSRLDGQGNTIITAVLENTDIKPAKKLLKITGYINDEQAALTGGIIDMAPGSITAQTYTVKNMSISEVKTEIENLDNSGVQIEKVSYFDGKSYNVTGFIKVGARQTNVDYLFETFNKDNYLTDYYRLNQAYNANTVNPLNVTLKANDGDTIKIEIPVKNSKVTSFKVMPQLISDNDNGIKVNNVLFNFSEKAYSRQVINIFYDKQSKVKDFVLTSPIDLPKDSITNYLVNGPAGIKDSTISCVKAIFTTDVAKGFMPYNYSYKISNNTVKYGFILNTSGQKSKNYILEVKLFKKGSGIPIVEKTSLQSDSNLICYSSTLDINNITKITAAIKDDKNKVISPKYFDIIYGK